MIINLKVCKQVSCLIFPCFTGDLFFIVAWKPIEQMLRPEAFSFLPFRTSTQNKPYYLSLEHFLYSCADRMMENHHQTLCHLFLKHTRLKKVYVGKYGRKYFTNHNNQLEIFLRKDNWSFPQLWSLFLQFGFMKYRAGTFYNTKTVK